MSNENKGFTDLSLKRLISKIKSTFVDKTDAVETTSINVDSVPTAGSNNLITSGGVYGAIDDKFKLGGYVTPEQFGAVGDGVTDDTEAVQRALDSPQTLTVLLSKNYKVTKTLTVRPYAKIYGTNNPKKMQSPAAEGGQIESYSGDYTFGALQQMSGMSLESAPTFVANKFFKKENGIFVVLTSQPSDWSTNFGSYYSPEGAVDSLYIDNVRIINMTSNVENETIAGYALSFKKGYAFTSLKNSTVTNCNIKFFEGACKSISSCTTISNNNFYGLQKYFIHAATDSFIQNNYINAAGLAARRTIHYSYTNSGTLYEYDSIGSQMIKSTLNNTAFASNFCDYWRTCFRDGGGHTSQIANNTFDDCIAVFRDEIAQVAITGNTFSNISPTTMQTKWSALYNNYRNYYNLLQSEEIFGIFVFDDSTCNTRTAQNVTRVLNCATFVGNQGRDCDYYIYSSTSAKSWWVRNCKFINNSLLHGAVNSATHYDSKVDVKFNISASETVASWGFLEDCYFDFWDDKVVDTLPSPNLSGNNVVSHKNMRVYKNGTLFINVNGTWKTSQLSEFATDSSHRTVTDAEKATWNGKQAAHKTATVNISVADWNGGTTVTKTVTDVTSSNDIMVFPGSLASAKVIGTNVFATAQGNGTITFAAETTPTESITYNIMIFD